MSSLLDVLQNKNASFQNCHALVYCNDQGDFYLATTLCQKIYIYVIDFFTCYAISRATEKGFLKTAEKVWTLDNLNKVKDILLGQAGDKIEIRGVTKDVRETFLVLQIELHTNSALLLSALKIVNSLYEQLKKVV